MARKHRRASYSTRPLPKDGAGFYGTQEADYLGEVYLFRHVGASAAQKFYVCPGCNQNIPPGVAHIVAWPRDYGGRVDDRRHWHKGCWNRR